MSVEEIKHRVLTHVTSEQDAIDEDCLESSVSKLMGSSAVSKRFMEWLVATDNIQEILDLIR